MPRAKKSKVVHLQNTKKKTKEHKAGLLTKVQKFLKDFQRVYLFEFENMTTAPFKELFEGLEDSKFCLGKRAILRLAFGTSEEDEAFKNSHLMGNIIKGQVGLLFTNQSHKAIMEFFKNIKVSQFANPGQVAIATVEL